MLYHTFPKVRKLTAEKLYTALLTMEDFSLIIPKEDDYDKAIEQLSETNWNDPLKEIAVGGAKERMYSYFGLKTQKQRAADAEATNATNGDTEMIQT